MGLRRYEKEFDTWAGNVAKKIKITSPVVSENVPYTIYQNIVRGDIKQDPLGISSYWQWNIMPSVPKIQNPYFWDNDHTFNLADKMISGTQYNDISAFVKAFASIIFAQLITTSESFSTRFDSRDYVEFSSKMQACFGLPNSGSFTVPYLTAVVGAGMVVPSEKRSVEFYIQFHMSGAQTFNNNTGLWSKVDNSVAYLAGASGITDAYFIPTEFSDTIDFFINSISEIDALPGTSPVYSGNGFAYTATSSTWVWFWYRINANTPMLDSIGYSSLLGFQTSGIWPSGWNRDGDIDPTPPDPDPDPEPYPPTPPIPPTPDPPVPVDPTDPIPEPDDPPIGGTDIGFMSIYNPDRSTLKHIASQFWDPTALEAIKQYFTNPMDSIIGLSIVPVAPVTGATEAVVIGLYNTHVGAPVVTTEYATHNCGSVYIPKFFNSYLDYDPYTKYQLYLPYIGEVELNADEITSKTITIKYKCNVVTGDCVALVMIGSNVFGTFNGNLSRQVPITAANYGDIISAAVNVATTAATVGVGVIGSQLTGEAIAENAVKGSTSELTSSGAIRATGAETAAMHTAATGAASLVNNVMSAKATYKKSGNVGQGAGQISVRTPFITITRPNLTLPENIDQASQSSLRRYVGYPTNKIGRLSSFSGLTVVEACKLSSQHATDGEIAEALEIMRGGVIL